jgi:hypothetical protein
MARLRPSLRPVCNTRNVTTLNALKVDTLSLEEEENCGRSIRISELTALSTGVAAV